MNCLIFYCLSYCLRFAYFGFLLFFVHILDLRTVLSRSQTFQRPFKVLQILWTAFPSSANQINQCCFTMLFVRFIGRKILKNLFTGWQLWEKINSSLDFVLSESKIIHNLKIITGFTCDSRMEHHLIL